MAEVDGIFKSLVDLIIMEHFIQTCSPKLVLLLKERMLKSSAAVAESAEQYIEAHCGSIASGRPNKLSNGAYNKQPQRPAASSASEPPDQAGRNLCASFAKRRDTLPETA